MFAKLFKYDFKATARVALPLLIALVIITVIGAINAPLTGGLISDAIYSEDSIGATIGMMFSVFTFIFVFIAIVAVAVILEVMILVNYYKSTATDEAYLTFTLPVKPRQILLSKVANASLWSLISVVAIVLCIAIIIVAMIIPMTEIPFEDDIVASSGPVGAIIFSGISSVIYFLVSIVSSPILYFMAITLGSTITRKNKLLCAVGCVIGVNFAYSILNNIISAIATAIGVGAGASTDSLYIASGVSMLIMTVITAGLTVLFYYLTVHMLEKKLNLA